MLCAHALSKESELLSFLYVAFDQREVDRILPLVHPEVEWPNGMEGGWVPGRDGLRAYWARQWTMLDPGGDDGRVVVHVPPVVRDLKGSVLVDRMVRHVYTIEDGLIRRMDVQQ
jgi:SnoaL-like domain